jgi:cysteine desulfurase
MAFQWKNKKSEIEIENYEYEQEYEEILLNPCTMYHSAYSPLCPAPKSEERKDLINLDLKKSIYFDNNATHPVLEIVKERIIEFLQMSGNASSKHLAGQKIRAYIEEARENICDVLQMKPDGLIFTSGGSESNNLILKGIAFKNFKNKRNKIITSTIEHKSVLKTCEWLQNLGYIVQYVPVDKHGFINEELLKDFVDENTLIVSIMSANNETGLILPTEKYYNIVKSKNENVLFHTDASQLLGKIRLPINLGLYDAVTISSHKFGGPIGVGSLFIKNKDLITPLIHGGNQEFQIRAGTYKSHQIMGMSKAVTELKYIQYNYIEKLRDYLESKLTNCEINYKNEKRLINTTNVKINSNHISDYIIEELSKKHIFISSGSACNAHEKNPSHVLKAIGKCDEDAYRTLRISLNRFNTKYEVDYFIKELNKII